MNVEQLATEVMENETDGVPDWHKLAGSAAETAANPNLDHRTRDHYCLVGAQKLLLATWLTHPGLPAADLLLVAARVAERADA